ncbi:serine/threonine-protein phosphatase 7 long form-like protein [Gossypium australe]|uniref:Serine/threonine-protein phosphatase 7 long form-like protein n=1 Tax=Gossypium australe TaxID=47621 RepID=A0A5B6WNR0_9ROSI|nr:serine/threonine-protein phosphatase 7 long form-like protein [Gossypium australe]
MVNVMVGPYRTLRSRMNGVGYLPDERLIPYLELLGFGLAVLIQTFDLRYNLIYALVERWRPETHTFHLLFRECTITLKDVAVQLGLLIDGSVITGISTISESTALCYDLLESLLVMLSQSLQVNFKHLLGIATERDVMCAVRAYIMHIRKGVLMLEANNNKVHLMYLSLLIDLHNIRSYSWSSSVLAMLYRELYQTTKSYAVDICGYLILIQTWALYRMPFLASVSHKSYVFPPTNRWSTYSGIWRSYTVPIYRQMIETHARVGILYEWETEEKRKLPNSPLLCHCCSLVP